MNILEQIVAQRRKDTAGFSCAGASRVHSTHRLRTALRAPDTNIIAEFKRASPSLGTIRAEARIDAIIPAYESAGACAISVLTEPRFFRGSLDDLREARALTRLPILRKDFILSESQIDEAALVGADAILLIVAILSKEELQRLCSYAEDQIGIDALVEVHDAVEMQRAVDSGANIIAVNNRDLRSFTTTLRTSEELAPLAPADATLVSESGIASAADIARLTRCGYDGFLVGESLMRADSPGAALRSLRAASPRVKVCGITTVADARLCGDLGVDMIGLNFCPGSKRCISPEVARAIIENMRPEYPALKFIGVFANQSVAIARELALDGVQLHGDESPEFVRTVNAPFVIKALRVNEDYSAANAEHYQCDAILLDSYSAILRGGSGESFDWWIAIQTKDKLKRLLLAGGLTSDNVANAIATVAPFAVDVCSGVEDAPGRKDPEKLRRFMAEARK